MDELEETFGEEFAEQYEKQVQQRRQQRESVSDEGKAEIADKAVNQNAFKQDNEPHFTHKTNEGITHDVLLMMLPNPDQEPIWNRVNKLDSGAVTCPLDYMGEWMSCLFNNPEDLRDMTPGSYYIVIGDMNQWENDAGEVFDQVSPVRGVISLEDAKQLAGKKLDDSGINEEEPEPEPAEEVNDPEPEDQPEPSFGGGSDEDEDEEDEEEGGFLGGGDEEEEPPATDEVDVGEVKSEVEELAAVDEQVWEVESGDPRLEKLGTMAAKRLDYDHEDEEVVEMVAGIALDRIQDEREEDEEEDDEEDALF